MTDKLDPFTQAYIDCALWCSVAYGSPEDPGDGAGNFDTSFEQANYSADDLSPRLLAHILEECKAFQEDNRELLQAAVSAFGMEDTQVGHDFWLTRNGHGAGFWDRGMADIGAMLTQSAKAYGTEDWYVVRDETDPDDYGVIDY